MLISCENEGIALDATKFVTDGIRAVASRYDGEFVYLNAMRAPKKRIQNKYRMQVLMRVKPSSYDIRSAIYAVADNVIKEYPQIACFTEINPNDLS